VPVRRDTSNCFEMSSRYSKLTQSSGYFVHKLVLHLWYFSRRDEDMYLLMNRTGRRTNCKCVNHIICFSLVQNSNLILDSFHIKPKRENNFRSPLWRDTHLVHEFYLRCEVERSIQGEYTRAWIVTLSLSRIEIGALNAPIHEFWSATSPSQLKLE